MSFWSRLPTTERAQPIGYALVFDLSRMKKSKRWKRPKGVAMALSVPQGRLGNLWRLATLRNRTYTTNRKIGSFWHDLRLLRSKNLLRTPRSLSGGGGKFTVKLPSIWKASSRSEEHTSELQSLRHLVCRLLL